MKDKLDLRCMYDVIYENGCPGELISVQCQGGAALPKNGGVEVRVVDEKTVPLIGRHKATKLVFKANRRAAPYSTDDLLALLEEALYDIEDQWATVVIEHDEDASAGYLYGNIEFVPVNSAVNERANAFYITGTFAATSGWPGPDGPLWDTHDAVIQASSFI